MANSIAAAIHIHPHAQWQRKTIDACRRHGYLGAMLLGARNAKTVAATVKYFICFFPVLAATALLAQAQNTTASHPGAIRKPDFTISTAGAITSGAIAFSANGLSLAVALEDSVKIYELGPGAQLGAKFTRTLTSDSPIQAMTFRESNTLVSLSADRSVTTWSTVSGRMLHSLSLDFGNFSVFTFAPGYSALLATADRNRVMLWNSQNGVLLNTAETTDSSVSALAFTPDGRLLAIGTHKGVLRVLDVATRKITRTMDLDSPICALSASMTHIVLGYSDGTLAELSFGGQTSTHEVSGHNEAVTAIAFSPQGERFASGSTDGTIKIWGTESLKFLASLKGSAAAIFSIVFSADGQTLVCSNTNGIISGWRLPANP